MSWKTHINSVATKISKTIGLIARLRHIVPTCTLLNIYQSLIVPYITYGLTYWGNACKTFLDQILVLQKRALRLIYFDETNDHAIPFFVKAKILPVRFLYYESVCNLMFDRNENNAPRNILNLFSRISSVHSYKTRSSTSDYFYIKESRINATRNAFSRVGVKIWNGIPATLKKIYFNFGVYPYLNLRYYVKLSFPFSSMSLIYCNFFFYYVLVLVLSRLD